MGIPLKMATNKIANNAKWIILCKIAQSLLQLVIGMFSARYLGPSNYGLLGYAGSVAAFALPLMQLGLQSTLIQEFIDTPDQEGRIMGTALIMDIVSGLVCIFMVAAFVSIANAGETETLIVCVLYSISLLFRALELLQCWFQYKLASKYPSIVMLCAYVVVSAYKIFLLASAKNIYWFALVNSLEFGITGIALAVIYRRLGSQKLSFSFEMASRLFARSKFYILAAMMVTIFQNTDHIMLKMLSGDIENGYYTAAVTCATFCQFLYLAITDSMRPIILANKKNASPEIYENSVSKLYCITTYMALFQGIGFTLFAKLIVRILYGQEFIASAPILRIIVWQIGFTFMGSVRNMWILAEGKQKLVWKLNLAGALINVLGNSLLIPRIGAYGAAVSSLATQIFTNFVLGFIIEPLRENNRLLIRGLNPLLLLESLRKKPTQNIPL